MEQTYDPTMNTSWYKFEQADKTVYELYYVENKCSREYAGYDRCTLAQSINKEDILKIIEMLHTLIYMHHGFLMTNVTMIYIMIILIDLWLQSSF